MKDLLGTHFLQVFGVFLVSLAVSYDSLFFWVQYPERNHDIIMMIAGAVNSNMLTGVILFFYGSSKSSSDKQKQLDSLNKEKTPG